MRETIFGVAVLLFGVQTEAGTITQTLNFDLQGHDTTFGNYNPYDPSLGPLNAVAATVNVISASGPTFELLNPTMNTISFNATLSGAVSTDAGDISSNSTMTLTLPPLQSTYVPAITIGEAQQLYLLRTSNLGNYIGGGIIAPNEFADSPILAGNVSVNNTSIVVTNVEALHVIGSETVTYYYGTTFFTPEPSSVVMMSLGLASVAVLAWRRRLVA